MISLCYVFHLISAHCGSNSELRRAVLHREPSPVYHLILMPLFLLPDVRVIALHLNNMHLVGMRLLSLKMT